MGDKNDPTTWGARTSALDVAARFSEHVKDRMILLTGPTVGGVGYATALALAKQGPKLLILAGRTVSKLEEARDKLRDEVPGVQLRVLKLDTSDMSSVRSAAEEINGYQKDIDIVINNAGVMDTPYTLTKDGFELQLATNYLGHWLLLNLIMPKVLAGRNKRVVNVSSMGHLGGDILWDDPHFKKSGYDRKKAYSSSKTAMNLHSIELTRRFGPRAWRDRDASAAKQSSELTTQHWSYEDRMKMNKDTGMTIYNEDGTANMSDDTPWKTPDQGASTSVRAALDPSIADHSGEYMDDCQLAPGNAKEYAKDPEAAKKAWAWTNEMLGTDF